MDRTWLLPSGTLGELRATVPPLAAPAGQRAGAQCDELAEGAGAQHHAMAVQAAGAWGTGAARAGQSERGRTAVEIIPQGACGNFRVRREPLPRAALLCWLQRLTSGNRGDR